MRRIKIRICFYCHVSLHKHLLWQEGAYNTHMDQKLKKVECINKIKHDNKELNNM